MPPPGNEIETGLSGQWLAMTRLALGNYLRSRHLVLCVGLALMPVLAAGFYGAFLLVRSGGAFTNPLPLLPAGSGRTRTVLEALDWIRGTFNVGFLHFGLFFAALTFGNSVEREESDEQTLHYYFLQPMPRWVLLAGKMTAFVAMAAPVFVGALLLVHLFALLPFGLPGLREAFAAGGVLRLVRMVLAVLVALVVFCGILSGLAALFRKPVFAVILYFWELMAGIAPVPEAVKQLSISHHLRELLPASARQQTSVIATLTEGPSALQTTLVLVLVPVVALGLGALMLSRRECIYADS